MPIQLPPDDEELMTPGQNASPGAPNASVAGLPDPAYLAPKAPAPPLTNEQIAAAGASVDPVSAGVPASVQPYTPASGFDSAMANDPNIATDKLSPEAARVRNVRQVMHAAAMKQIAINGGGNPNGKVSIAPEAPKPPEAGAPIAPIGAKPGALGGAGGASAGPMIDVGAVAPRPGGPNKALQAAMSADQKKIDDARLATEASTNESQDELRKAAQAHEDTALSQQAAIQKAVDSGDEIQSQQDTFRQQTIARQDALDAERKEKLAKLDAAGIDPKKYWNDKSTGDKVLTGIGVALGALGAGLAKTENFAGKMFESAINRDVESQRENIEKQAKSVAALGEMQKEGLSRAQWVDQQMNQRRQMGFEVAQKQVAGYAAMSDSAETKAKAQQAIGMLEQQKQGVRAQDAANHLAALQKQALAAGAPSADQVALQKARATQLNTMIEKRAANGEKPLTNVEMQNLLAGRGELAGGGAVPGLVGGFSPGENKSSANKKATERAEAEANAGATVDAQAKGLLDTSVWNHPIDKLNAKIGTQGTVGADAARAGQVWNAGAIADIHRLAGVRDPDKARELAEGMLWKPGMTAASIDKMVEARRKFAKSFSASPGAAGPGLPAGAKVED